jgi:hypothetical protein
MKVSYFLFTIVIWQVLSATCSAQTVDPVHQKYWLLRARFRDQFIVRGVDPLPVCEQKTFVYGIPVGSKKPYSDDIRYTSRMLDGTSLLSAPVTVQADREDSCGAFILGAVSDDYPLA